MKSDIPESFVFQIHPRNECDPHVWFGLCTPKLATMLSLMLPFKIHVHTLVMN